MQFFPQTLYISYIQARIHQEDKSKYMFAQIYLPYLHLKKTKISILHFLYINTITWTSLRFFALH